MAQKISEQAKTARNYYGSKKTETAKPARNYYGTKVKESIGQPKTNTKKQYKVFNAFGRKVF
jgi:hypothetical protein